MGDGTLLGMLRCIRVTATETAQIAQLSFVTFQLGTKEFEVALTLLFVCIGAAPEGSSSIKMFYLLRKGTWHHPCYGPSRCHQQNPGTIVPTCASNRKPWRYQFLRSAASELRLVWWWPVDDLCTQPARTVCLASVMRNQNP